MKIPSNFEINKYDLQVRLVNENDASFILNLRSENKARFLSAVAHDAELQKQWIHQYKIREQAGLDYYFIYYKNGIPLGLNRIYNIKEDSFVGGSFIFTSGCDFEIPILATLIEDYVGFEILGKSARFGNIHKDNKKAIKFNKLYGADFIYEDENEIFLITTKNMYCKIKEKLERVFNVS